MNKFIFDDKMGVSFKEEYLNHVSLVNWKKILSVNDVESCDKDGNLLDKDGDVITENPCGFSKTYNCYTKKCQTSGWFLFIVIGLPILMAVILVIGIGIIIRSRERAKS